MQKGNIHLTSFDHQVYFEKNRDQKLDTYLRTRLRLSNEDQFGFTFRHSRHSRKRASQRSFDYNVLLTPCWCLARLSTGRE